MTLDRALDLTLIGLLAVGFLLVAVDAGRSLLLGLRDRHNRRQSTVPGTVIRTSQVRPRTPYVVTSEQVRAIRVDWGSKP